MNAFTIHVSEDVEAALADLARSEGVSFDELVQSALASIARDGREIKRLDDLARRTSAAEFRHILERAPDVPPIPGDERL